MVKVKQIDFIKDRKQRIHAFKDAYSRQEIERLKHALDSAMEEMDDTIDGVNTLVDQLNARNDEIESMMRDTSAEMSGQVTAALKQVTALETKLEEALPDVYEAAEKAQSAADAVEEALAQFSLDETLSKSGEAAEAAAVGAALDAKLDKSAVVNRTDVTTTGSAADAVQLNPNVSGTLAHTVSEHTEIFEGVNIALENRIQKSDIKNTNNITGTGSVADARQLNPNISGSLAASVKDNTDGLVVVQNNIEVIQLDITDINTNLVKKLDKASVVNNGTTTEAGYALDARYGKKLTDDVNSLVTGKRYVNYDGQDTSSHNLFTVHTSPLPTNGATYINVNDTIASIVGVFEYDKKAARSASWTTLITFTDEFANNVIGRTFLNITAFVESASGSEAVTAWKGKVIPVELDTWNETKRLRVFLPVALTTTDSFRIMIGSVIPVTK